MLTNLDGMAGLINLTLLHLDHNQLTSLETMPIMLKLQTLTCTNNKISDTESAVRTLAMKCPRLQHLNLTGNPLDVDPTKKKYRKGIKKMLPMLLSLDGVAYEAVASQPQVA